MTGEPTKDDVAHQALACVEECLPGILELQDGPLSRVALVKDTDETAFFDVTYPGEEGQQITKQYEVGITVKLRSRRDTPPSSPTS